MRLKDIPDAVLRAGDSDAIAVRDAFRALVGCALVGPDTPGRYEGTAQDAAHALEAACIGLSADQYRLPQATAYAMLEAGSDKAHLFVAQATYAQAVDYVRTAWPFFISRIEGSFPGKVKATVGPYRKEVREFDPDAAARDALSQTIAEKVAAIGAGWQTLADMPRGRQRELKLDGIRQHEADLLAAIEKRDRLDWDGEPVH